MPGTCLEVQISEKGRLVLIMVLTVLNGVALLLSLVLIGCGTYIKLAVEEKLNLIGDYDNDVLPYILIALGLLAFIISILGMMAMNYSQDLNTRGRVKDKLLPYLAVEAFLAICILSASFLTFAQISHIHNSFGIGIGDAMRKYKYEKDLKQQLDGLQMDYRCCGMKSYDDWFKVSWIHDTYLSNSSEIIRSKMVQGEYYNDDAPFSCCNPSSHRPCIHHHVHHNDAHYNYDYKVAGAITLHMTGCQDALAESFRTLLVNCGAVIIGIFCVQVLLIICLRYLQTSITMAYEQDEFRPTLDTPGWLFGSFGGNETIYEDEDGENERLLDSGQNGSNVELSNKPRNRPGRGSGFSDDNLNNEPIKHKTSVPYSDPYASPKPAGPPPAPGPPHGPPMPGGVPPPPPPPPIGRF